MAKVIQLSMEYDPMPPFKGGSPRSAQPELVEADTQLIVATHSPLLLAFPGARILQFDEAGVQETGYDGLEHVTLMRGFLSNPDRFIRDL